MLSAINNITQDKSICIGDIEITNRYTFFDVFEDQAQQVLDAFDAAGQPLTVAEPREVTSKAPRESKRSGKPAAGQSRRGGGEQRYDGSEGRKWKEKSRYSSDKAFNNSVRSKLRSDNYSADDWRNLFDDTNAEKPWRNRRR